ncbi:hypothetical protein FJZ18_01670 [Candidatus Pacearchaeota archaeon]|nr:hypothetical protein [Candidatus Pacearchaeota archaeon]
MVSNKTINDIIENYKPLDFQFSTKTKLPFKEFYICRLSTIVADNQVDYALQRLTHAIKKPFYYLEWFYDRIQRA